MAPAVSESAGTAPTTQDLSDVLREYMDVTGRLQQTHEALQREIVRLRDELASKDRELELRRRLAALGELAAGVAHEVRNPLGAIQLYSGLLRHQCRQHNLGSAVQLVEKIEAGIQAIEAVVQDTLALAPRDRQLPVCNLRRIVEQARDATLKTLTTCRVRLEVLLPDEEILVRAEEDGLQRVLVNLVVNAAEASPAERVVQLQIDTAPEQVEVRVQDEGPGLPEEFRHRLFDPFFTTKQHGTGLGLTIAHRLIDSYGGRLTADNRPEGGAEFVITLPTAQATEARKEPETRTRKPSVA